MSEEVSAKAISSSVKWVALVKLISQLATFGTTLLVLHFLNREDFGLASMAFVVLAVIDSMIDFGFAAALIQRREVSDNDYSACFWVLLGVALLIMLAMLAGGGVFGWLFNEPRVVPLLQTIALMFLVTPVHIVYRARLTKQFRLAYLAKCDLVGLVIRSLTSIVCAYAGLGVWSLILGFVSEKLLIAVLIALGARWLPSPRADYGMLQPLLKFGLKITLDRIVYAVLYRIDVIIVGRMLGADALGLYSLAQQFVGAIIQIVMTTGVKVAYPLFAAYQSSDKLLPSLYRAERLTMLVSFAGLTGLALVAHDLISVAMAERWLGAATYIQILCVAGVFQVMAGLLPQLLNAINRSGLNLGVNSISLAVSTLVLYGALEYGGERELLFGIMLAALVRYVFVVVAAKWALPGLSVKALAKVACEMALCTLCMSAVVLVIKHMAVEWNALLRLVVCIVSGVAAYAAAHLLLFKSETLDTLRVLRS